MIKIPTPVGYHKLIISLKTQIFNIINQIQYYYQHLIMDRLFNCINLLGWSFVMFHLAWQVNFNREAFLVGGANQQDVWAVRIVQSLQGLDLLLILIGKSKGSLINAGMQYFGRMFVAWYFLEFDSNILIFVAMVIPWSIADTNRYIYYLFPNSRITGFLRYHLFIVLYPIGVSAQLFLINDYIKRHAETLNDNCIMIFRVLQVLDVIGMLFIYFNLLKARSKWIKANFSGQAVLASQPRDRSRSPRAKRQ